MQKPFREHHALAIFSSYEKQTGPLDLFLKNYFLCHKAIGAKDRKSIAESVYGIMRWRGLLDHKAKDSPSWETRYHLFQQFSPLTYLKDTQIPLHVRLSFPKKFFSLLVNSLGEEKAMDFCLVSNAPAPTTIRVNTLKISREALLERWKDSFAATPCTTSSTGITFLKKVNFFALPEFKSGFFEVQDEASQLIAQLVAARPGQQILDFCSGSGGKALAIAPRLEEKGQLYLHDIRRFSLMEAKKRLKRAGIQNAQLLFHDAEHKKRLKKTMDWVLVDVPCTGSGTLRRNPDMKWKFQEEDLEELIIKQRAIFHEALDFVKPRGHIVYSTCSILSRENQEQADFFTTHYPLERIDNFSSFPQAGGMDGFFGTTFQLKE